MKLEEENPNGFRLGEPDQCAANRVLGTVQNQIHPPWAPLVCYTAVFSGVTQRCVTTLKTAV